MCPTHQTKPVDMKLNDSIWFFLDKSLSTSESNFISKQQIIITVDEMKRADLGIFRRRIFSVDICYPSSSTLLAEPLSLFSFVLSYCWNSEETSLDFITSTIVTASNPACCHHFTNQSIIFSAELSNVIVVTCSRPLRTNGLPFKMATAGKIPGCDDVM